MAFIPGLLESIVLNLMAGVQLGSTPMDLYVRNYGSGLLHFDSGLSMAYAGVVTWAIGISDRPICLV